MKVYNYFNFLFVLFIFNLLINGNYGEVDSIIMDSLSSPMPPFTFSLKKDNPIGTVVSIYGIRKPDTAIHYLNSINQTAFFISLSTLPNPDDEYYNLAVRKEDKGYRVFLNGEEIKFYQNQNYCQYVFVNKSGTLRTIVYYNEPVWTMDQSYHDMRIYDYEPEGFDNFPKKFELANFNSDVLQYGDFISITGQIIDDGSKNIYMDLFGDSENLPYLQIMIQPRYTQISMFAITNGTKSMQTYMKHPASYSRFTITLYCEKRGWRIYYNGEEFTFFYHYISPKIIKNIILQSEDKNWKLQKFTIKHT